jgi:branched-chain amino acid transport system substrate-binding protein
MKLSRHALAVVFAWCGIATATAGDEGAKQEIRIGQTLPYSGPVSGFGIIGRA